MKSKALVVICLCLMPLLAAFAEETPNVGDKAPLFQAAAHPQPVNLAGLIGKQNIVLYFYPKDFTPGCTVEACDLRDGFEALKGLDAIVLGVSYDSVESHAKFAAHYKLPFGLIADTDHRGSELYGAAREKFCSRVTFVINKSGRIAWRNLTVNAKQAAAEIKAALEQLKQQEKK
ncbi:MAG: peroxiredoxin [Verrucomicrobia bacterium]|nr:peroxiredoxin [Verrucomicrobiota bacterium]